LSTESTADAGARRCLAQLPHAAVGIFLLYSVLAVTASPLLDSSIDAEKVTDDIGSVVKKSAAYAPTYFLGKGFFDAYVDAMNSSVSAVSWYPQIESKPAGFLNFTFLDQSTYSSGACAILDSDGPECILMTGRQGSARDASRYRYSRVFRYLGPKWPRECFHRVEESADMRGRQRGADYPRRYRHPRHVRSFYAGTDRSNFSMVRLNESTHVGALAHVLSGRQSWNCPWPHSAVQEATKFRQDHRVQHVRSHHRGQT